ncbi:hypothetical protein E1B28_013070 [Marasmius oreades]|uniref:Uncharacterized protein n=1 Tax=Marasmius oreades TaxID=181124 RepID=A0A9P7RQ82_9AGAR|nr:uncharacterized protein E1B28_013070 [Marasmius oreades]KAG7087088.1 hypothetical protein E1B28_013070 [Marasmius oreades]
MSLESLKTEHIGFLLTFESFDPGCVASSVLWSCPSTLNMSHNEISEDDLVEVNFTERRRYGPHRRRQLPTAHEESDLLRSLGILSLHEEKTSKARFYAKKDMRMLVKCERSHPYNGYSPPPSPSRSNMRHNEARILPPSPRKPVGCYHSVPLTPKRGVCNARENANTLSQIAIR